MQMTHVDASYSHVVAPGDGDSPMPDAATTTPPVTFPLCLETGENRTAERSGGVRGESLPPPLVPMPARLLGESKAGDAIVVTPPPALRSKVAAATNTIRQQAVSKLLKRLPLY